MAESTGILTEAFPAGGGGTVAPTYPASADLASGTGTRSFAAVTTQANDWLVFEMVVETSASGTPAMSPLTWTQQNDIDSGSIRTEIFQFTAQDTTGGSRTIQVVPGTTAKYRARLTVVRGSAGPGTGKATAAAQTVSVSRQGNNSGMFMTVGDWNAGAVGAPVWTPGGATVASQQDASAATYVFGRWDSSGAAATANHGVSSPAYGVPSIAVLEMLGT
jgi:hypothetical protein